jgi:anti-sigma-K factor RskA
MGPNLTADERRSLLGVYALGALDDDERRQVEDLVLEDASARAELHTLQLGVAWLDHASTRAPMHVWREIAREIEPEVRVQPANVVPLHRRRAVRRVAAVAAAIVFVVAGAVGVLIATGDGSSSPPTVAALAAKAQQLPRTDTSALLAPDGARFGKVVVAPDRAAYLVWSDNLPKSKARTYQLWELTPDGPRSAGLLGGDPTDRAFHVTPRTAGVAVTLEPRGGSPAPTTTPLVVAQFD